VYVLVSAIALTLSSCGKREYAGTVVDQTSGRAVAAADVYLHTSRGTPLDRNQYYSHTTTDASGRYCFVAPPGRFEALVAMAHNYYPAVADAIGRVELTPVPEAPLLPAKRGRVRIDPDGTVWGYSFANDGLVAASVADIVPIVPADSRAYIEQLRGVSPGGLVPIAYEAQGWWRYQCAYLRVCLAPAEGYQDGGLSDRICFVRCRDGEHYAKFGRSHGNLGVDGGREVEFEYAYQPDGSRVLPVDFELDKFKAWFYGAAEEKSPATNAVDRP
jgi:hypothetical protein